MRIKHLEINSSRVTTAFAFMPIKIGKESRWLETVKYEETFKEDEYGFLRWLPTRFIDDNNS